MLFKYSMIDIFDFQFWSIMSYLWKHSIVLASFCITSFNGSDHLGTCPDIFLDTLFGQIILVYSHWDECSNSNLSLILVPDPLNESIVDNVFTRCWSQMKITTINEADEKYHLVYCFIRIYVTMYLIYRPLGGGFSRNPTIGNLSSENLEITG